MATTTATTASNVQAKTPKALCVEAHEGAQMDIKASRFSSARERLIRCLATTCPPTLQVDCAEWMKELERRQPSVVLSFRGQSGEYKIDTPVNIDGMPLSEKTDGKAIEVDPGEHTFVFRPVGEPWVTVKTIVREGERAQRVDGVARQDPLRTTTPVTSAPPRFPWEMGIALGVSAAALGTGVGFGAAGLSNRGDLEVCSPACAPDQVDSVRRQFIVADIGFVSAGIALIAAGIIYFVVPREESAKSPSTR
jgi:hypothetical protein